MKIKQIKSLLIFRNMKTLWQRLNSETPKFWKRFIFIGSVLTVVSASIIGAPDDIAIPEWLREAAGYAATAGFVIAALGKATTTDSELSEN